MTAVIAALWLTACGGGGGDGGPAPAPAPAPGTGQSPAPAPGPAPAPAPAPAAGLNWTATGPQDAWHWLSSSADGQVMVAGQAEASSFDTSFLSLSTDGGQTWTERPELGGAVWISSDVSADGNRIVVVTLDGRMLLSSDRGATFVPIALPAGVTSPSFESVTLSSDGTRIAAAAMSGPVIVGEVAADGSAVNWITPTGLPPTAGWRSIDSSDNGQVMVVVSQGPTQADPAAAPAAFISSDAGATWTPLAVAIGDPATPVTDQNWYRVDVSGDGNTIVMVANAFAGGSGNGIYVSKDRGTTFARTFELATDYSSIASSTDGGVIIVTHSSNQSAAGEGQVLLSTNGGATFAPMAINVDGAPATDTAWRAVTMSADATRMAVAAGRFVDNPSLAGRIYVSSGSRPQ